MGWPDMSHVMIDLETMGTSPGCAIVSIGAVAFDPRGGDDFSRTFYRAVSLESCQQAGLRLEAGTVAWWMAHGSEARAVFATDMRAHLLDALMDFSEWMRDYRACSIWANGASFDFPILSEAYRAFEMDKPWSYWYECCYRTVKNCWRSCPAPARVGIAHHALDDAIHQARHLQIIFSELAPCA